MMSILTHVLITLQTKWPLTTTLAGRVPWLLSFKIPNENKKVMNRIIDF